MENRSLIYSGSSVLKLLLVFYPQCFGGWAKRILRLIMTMSAGCCVCDRSSLTLRLRTSVHLVLDTFLSCTLQMFYFIYTLSLSETR